MHKFYNQELNMRYHDGGRNTLQLKSKDISLKYLFIP